MECLKFSFKNDLNMLVLHPVRSKEDPASYNIKDVKEENLSMIDS